MEVDGEKVGALTAMLSGVGAGLMWMFRAGRKTQQMEAGIKMAKDDSHAALHGLKEVCQALGELQAAQEQLRDAVHRSHKRIDEIYSILVSRGDR